MDRIIWLKKDSPLAWAYMPQALQRVRDFCQRYDSEASPEFLSRLIETHFILDEPLVALLLGLKDTEVVGHLLASIDDWCGVRFLTIIQWEMDAPLDDNLKQIAFESLQNWAREKGAVSLQVLARNAAAARLFERRYGLVTKRILMRKPI